MPTKPSAAQVRLNNLIPCLATAANTVDMLASSFKNPVLVAITNTTQSLLQLIQTVKQNKADCAQLMEQTDELINAIILVYTKSDTGTELSPGVLMEIGKFTETLHKIHAFVEAQQSGSKIKMLFRQGEMNTLLQDCKAGLQQGLDFFQIKASNIMSDIKELEENARKQQDEVLQLIETLSDTSSIQTGVLYAGSYTSSTSISMLPSEPKIFYGRESELIDILGHFSQGTPRIAILGAGGMGKTSLAKAILHHTEITTRYGQYRFFVTTDSVTNAVELAAQIGAHMGLKPATDPIQPLIQHLSTGPPCLLILDNLETGWEPSESRKEVENLLSLVTQVAHVAVMITMRGAERPSNVAWTRPFLPPLKPLSQTAAQQVFLDITDDDYEMEEINSVLNLTDNMPLAINLLAHLVSTESCSSVLFRWEDEKTSLISDGHDRRSNLDLSISVSLSSPRLKSLPQALDLLSLLSILPDGLSDAELRQSNLPLDDILGCKIALIRTTLAYSDEHRRLKVLVPIREYMQKIRPPGDATVHPMLKYFQQSLELYMAHAGNHNSPGVVARVISNYSNIQNVIRNGLHPGHPDLVDSIYCACHLNSYTTASGRGKNTLIDQVSGLLPRPCNPQLEVHFIAEFFNSIKYHDASNADRLHLEALQHFDNFDDADLKCRYYDILARYYLEHKNDMPTATDLCESGLALAISAGNVRRQCDALDRFSWIQWYKGNHHAARQYAFEAQRLARTSGAAAQEAQALRMEAMCLTVLGDYQQALVLCARAQGLVPLCGIVGGDLDHCIRSSEAEIHKFKSEYIQAQTIQKQILEDASLQREPYMHTIALLNMTEINLFITSPDVVRKNLKVARALITTTSALRLMNWCDVIEADLLLSEGVTVAAKSIFIKCFLESLGTESELSLWCLERLGNVNRWAFDHSGTPIWPVLLLTYAVKYRDRLRINQALQFLGDVFLSYNDASTALTLFTVALEEFTYMDVHRSRGECMVRLGDIEKARGNSLKARTLWEPARALFEHSSQLKQIQEVEGRLGGIAGGDFDPDTSYLIAESQTPARILQGLP
ncbi:hypothetical protein B0H16DRAFT_1564798 [Mycena metata]|uniref:Novel STAND NTPase 1 domain-containing protein n=1 Tax=Mycena metata TaxID=1033252 RepID=A0AAD7IGV4_9AGAR|nr:hypothetical protein B0H16DRAFT_1564798 [Mycena metata]